MADSTFLQTELKTDSAGPRPAIARLDADKPSKTCTWGILTVSLTAYGCRLPAPVVRK